MDRSIRARIVDSMTEDQILESIAGHRQRNIQLRQALSDKKVNLSEQRPTDVHFYAWSQSDAAVLARELFKKGFLVKVLSPSPEPGDEELWNIEAGAQVVPEEILGDEFTEGMVRLAARFDSVYDGWGTSV